MATRLLVSCDSRGFTLLEVVFALFLIAVGVIATAPLFVFASKQNSSGRDLGTAGAAAVHQLEALRTMHYNQLPNGGDLYSDVNGYFDDSDPELLLRWTITSNPNPPAETKIITVRAIANNPAIGQPKDVVIVTLRGT